MVCTKYTHTNFPFWSTLVLKRLNNSELELRGCVREGVAALLTSHF